jgi:hypothetical protein
MGANLRNSRMRHCLAVLVGPYLSIFPIWALACTCPIFDPQYILANHEHVFVGEITSWAEHDVRKASFFGSIEDVTPFTYNVVESFKGGSAPPQGLLALGRPSSCWLYLVIGEHYVFELNSDMSVVGQCSVSHLPTHQLDALRLAASPTSSRTITEAEAVAIARDAFSANDARLTAHTVDAKRDQHGWMVTVWLENGGPGDYRIVLIDPQGNVTAYKRGL